MFQPDRDEVEKLIAERTSGIRAGVANIRGSFRNRAFANMNPGNAGLPTAPTDASLIIVGAALLNVLGSGIFQASVDFTLTGVTATDTLVIDVGTQTVASGLTLSAAGTKVGPGNGAAANGVYTSNAAGGIVVTGGGGALIQYGSGTYVFGGGATTSTFGWSGVIMNSVTATTETPFTRGNQILLTLSLNLSANALVFQSFGMSIYELT